MLVAGSFKSLNKKQVESIGLLLIGTFLEYFDLFLYVHMTIFLNGLFFPKIDPHTEEILSAFAFCSTFIFRPLGALIFGYIGDTFGRKSTIILTTWIMALSCLIMANLPTYAQIGISAAYLVTFVRILQGMSSLGEVIGAEVFVTEITKPPVQYSLVETIAVCGALGSTAALGVGSLVTSEGFDWRLAFWLGASIATIGGVARTHLRESTDYTKARGDLDKAQLRKARRKVKVNKTTTFALFCIRSAWPLCFYFAYMYYGNILKNQYGYTAEEVIKQNLLVATGQLVASIVLVFLTYRINPLIIVRVRLLIFTIFILLSPVILPKINTADMVLYLQLFVVVFGMMATPALPIFYKHLPVFKRFTYASFTYALSRALMYVVTSFGLVYLGKMAGPWIMFCSMLPMAIIFFYSIQHFVWLEKRSVRKTAARAL